jgi:hypothetical protein
VVLHITEDQAAFKPVRIDQEVFDHFTTLRRTFEWVNKTSKTVLGDPIWSTDGALITGTQRRA